MIHKGVCDIIHRWSLCISLKDMKMRLVEFYLWVRTETAKIRIRDFKSNGNFLYKYLCNGKQFLLVWQLISILLFPGKNNVRYLRNNVLAFNLLFTYTQPSTTVGSWEKNTTILQKLPGIFSLFLITSWILNIIVMSFFSIRADMEIFPPKLPVCI